MTIVIKGARVLTFDENDCELSSADVLIEGSIITAVGRDLPTPAGRDLRVIDGAGHLVMPGLVNAHLHSPGNFLKGALDDAPLEIFMLYEVPPLGDTPEPPRLNYLRTLLGAVEMLKLGITAVHDDAYFNPFATAENIAAIMGAYRDAGMRATVALDQPNVREYEKYPFLRDLLPPDLKAAMQAAPIPSDRELLSLYRDFLAEWHGAADGRLRCSTSCSAPQRVTPAYLEALTDLSRAHDLPFNIHILETRLQRVLGEEKYGKSLIRYVDDLGVLDERKLVIHAVWVDEDDIAVMARSGCAVAHNPISNLKLGSGVMPFRQIRDAGIPIALGTDEAAVDDSANLWTVAKMTGLIHKISDPDWTRWPRAAEVLDCAIRGGARSMRLDRAIGKIAAGYQADLIVVDLDTIPFTPLNDIRRQLVFCESGASVSLVIVDGTIVVEDGKILTVDESALRAEIRATAEERRAVFAETHSHAEKLVEYYTAMYQAALARDVGMERLVPPFVRT